MIFIAYFRGNVKNRDYSVSLYITQVEVAVYLKQLLTFFLVIEKTLDP